MWAPPHLAYLVSRRFRPKFDGGINQKCDGGTSQKCDGDIDGESPVVSGFALPKTGDDDVNAN
jgi:hypothetical protein